MIFNRFGSINEDNEDYSEERPNKPPVRKDKSIVVSSNIGSLSSANHHADSSHLLTTAEINCNKFEFPSTLQRKPSITFSETVLMIKSERRNSSPGIIKPKAKS